MLPDRGRNNSGAKPKPDAPRHFADLVSHFPAPDDPPHVWAHFLEDELLSPKLSPDRVHAFRKQVLALFRLPDHEFPDKALFTGLFTGAFLAVMDGGHPPRFPPPVAQLLDDLRERIGFWNAMDLLKATAYEPMKTKLRIHCFGSLVFEHDPALLLQFIDHVVAEKGPKDPLIIDDHFARPCFLELFTSALATRVEDRQFMHVFFRTFEVRSHAVRQALFRVMSASSQDFRDFDKFFHNMRFGAIMSDFRKFPLEVIEEKIRDPKDFQILFDVLRSQTPRRLNEAYSLLMRHSIELRRHADRALFANHAKFDYLEPALRSVDSFNPTCFNLGEPEGDKALSLADFGVYYHHVVFVNSPATLALVEAEVLASRMVGFDSEFCRASYNPFEKHRLALAQIFNGARVFLFDCLDLRGSAPFADFLRQLFGSKEVIKVGLGMSSDFKVMEEYLGGAPLKCQAVVDLARGIQMGEMVSLKTLCEHVFRKPLCKYEQASAWDQRPLRLAQIHYAALDAVAAFKIAESVSPSKTVFEERPISRGAGELADLLMTKRKADRDLKEGLQKGPGNCSHDHPAPKEVDGQLPGPAPPSPQIAPALEPIKRTVSKAESRRSSKQQTVKQRAKHANLSSQSQPFIVKEKSKRLKAKPEEVYVPKEPAPFPIPAEGLPPVEGEEKPRPKKKLRATSKPVEVEYVVKAERPSPGHNT